MTALTFEVLGTRAAPNAAAPALLFRLAIARPERGERVHAVALRATIQIDARRRRYGAEEQRRLYDVFGEPSLWDRSLKPLTWAYSTVLTPAFDDRIEVDLPVSCTYDFEVAAAKYLHAVQEGEIPLVFLFSGTMFFAGDRGFMVEPVAWDAEAAFRMPATAWREAMDRFFPGSAWIRIRRDTFDALHAFRARQAAADWDAALGALLRSARAEEPA